MEPDEDATPPTLDCPEDPPPPIALTDDDIIELVIEWCPVVGSA